MPTDAVGGWRRDVVDAVKAAKPGIIRFGGSALDVPEFGDFEWRDTIGDPDRRKPLRAWGGLQPTGAGLEEIVQFCQLVAAEPMICVRTVGRPPKDAADQVEYFNGATDTPMGKLRAKNGHAEPYGVKYWQIGNERAGAEYEAQLKPFAEAMRKVDPSIKLLSSFPSKGTLRSAGDLLDYVAPHQYDVMNVGGADAELNSIREMIGPLAPGRPIKVAVTEWNTTAGDFGPPRARLWTLENALAVARYQNLLHRHCDLVEIANRSNLANSFCSGMIQTDNHRLYVTPAYHAQRLYATLAGDRPLKVESAVPVDAAPDVSATLSDDGKTMTLFAVNAGTDAMTRPLDLTAFGETPREVAVWTLTDQDGTGEPDATNAFTRTDRVAPVESRLTVTAGKVDYRFPALSLTVVCVPVSP